MRARTLAAATAVFMMVIVAASPAHAAPPPPSPTTVMSCEKLAAAVKPTAAFAPATSLRIPARTELDGSHQQLPSASVFRTAGALVCEWSNGRLTTSNHSTDGWIGVRLEFMTNTGGAYAEWDRWFDGTISPEHWDCLGAYGCFYATNAGGDWLQIDVTGARSEAIGLSLARRISNALQLGLQGPYARPTSKWPLGSSCEDVIPVSRFSEAIRPSRRIVYVPSPIPAPSMIDTAKALVPAPACWVGTADGSDVAAEIFTVPNGRWAFDEVRTALVRPGPLVALPGIPTLRAGDEAYIRCAPARSQCILDLLVADHWVQVDLYEPLGPGTPLITTDRITAARTIAQWIALSVYS
jgi:hypothetical protein